MVGKTVTLAAAAVLLSTAEASPFFKWSPWGAFTQTTGLNAPSAYAPNVPKYTAPAWPWWPVFPSYTTTELVTASSSKHTTSSVILTSHVVSTTSSSHTTSTTPSSHAVTKTSESVTSSPLLSTKSVVTLTSSASIATSGTASSSGLSPSTKPTGSAVGSSSPSASISVSTKNASVSASGSTSTGSASLSSSTATSSGTLPGTTLPGTTLPGTTLPVSESTITSTASKSKISACSNKSNSKKSGSASASVKISSQSASLSASTGIVAASISVSASSNAPVQSITASSSSQASASLSVSSGKKSRSACSARSQKSTASASVPSISYTSSGAASSSLSGSSASASVSRTRASGSAISTGLIPSGTANSPCGSIAQLVATQTAAVPTVPAELGLACLNSIPFNQSAAVSYLDSIRPYLNWQSTIEYLKSPPAEYAAKVQPAYDFRANYERIYNQAVAGNYLSEYQFGFDVYRAFQRAHDGHFVIYPASVSTIITFGRRTPLVSVSLDGVSVPEVYVYSDVLAASFGNSTFTPSALTQINGQNSTEFLLDFSQNGSLQDRDALWNNVFYELAQVALGASGTGTGTFTGSGRGRFIYPGPITTLAFANGTSVTYKNFARVLGNFNGITNGQDVYNRFLAIPGGEPQGALFQATSTSSSTSTAPALVSSSAVSASLAASTTAASATIPKPGYPTDPVVNEMNNLNAGYFLEGAGYNDVAVLAVNSFVGTDTDELDFQAVNTYLINQAVQYNKTKLIIDVSANGGGTILQGYDLFKQLFPQIEPYGANRARAHDALNIVGQEFSAYSDLVPRTLNANATTLNIVSSYFNYMTDLDINEKPFTSWQEKYNPMPYGPQPDNFTATFRWNLSDVLTPINSGGIYVSGYQNRSNITTQPFAAENIVVVTDGYCASTCTIFSELMRQQGNVKYVALGGRPDKDIIQAVGGVKGTNDLPYGYILGVVEQVFAEPLLDSREDYNNTVLGQYNDQVLLQSSASVVNFRDGLRKGDTSETPLQFVYEPADCRIYYTPEMTIDITAAWKAVADTAFNGVNRCVAGSLSSTAAPQRRSLGKHKRHSSVEKRMLFDSAAAIHLGQGSNVPGADSVMII